MTWRWCGDTPPDNQSDLIRRAFLDLTGDVGSVSSSRVPEVCQCVRRHCACRGDGWALGAASDCRVDEHARYQSPLQFIRGRGFKNVWWPASLRPVQGHFLRQTVREKNCNSRSAQATGIRLRPAVFCFHSTARLLPVGRARVRCAAVVQSAACSSPSFAPRLIRPFVRACCAGVSLVR